MKMNANDLMDYMGSGMEINARKILIKEKLAKVEEVAIMSCWDVCAKILEHYEVISCDGNDIILVKRDNMDTYKSITNVLSNLRKQL